MIRILPLVAAALLLCACTSVSSNYNERIEDVSGERLVICHGFDCRNQTPMPIGARDAAKFRQIFAGVTSADAERRAVAGSVQHFENMATAKLGVVDEARSTLSQTGQHGQMDCIDESTNTRTLLRYLHRKGLLRHHDVRPNVTRGRLFDARYFHATAVLKDRQGREWAIDSWYEPAGRVPDILPLEDWMELGIFGAR